MMRRLLATLILATVLGASAPARADDTAEARSRFREGAELYRAKQYREAISRFEEAYRLKPAAAIHYNVAQCREKLGEWPAAIRSYHDYLREAPEANDRAVVRAAIQKLEERLSATGAQPLLVYTDPPGAEVRIDGRARGTSPFHLVLPPGSYEVALALEGYERIAMEIAMRSRAAHVLDLQLRPSQPAPVASTAPATQPSGPAGQPPKPDLALRAAPPAAGAHDAADVGLSAQTAPREKRRIYTWIAGGTAVVAAAVGGYYGWSARRAESALHDGDGDANANASDATSRARRANVLYAVAGSAAAAGVTLFFVEKKF
ncbi:PEGA domain-containing protein [Anaeromyxobacter sp. Fw109-5]|uniref:PEGA domain-containing protein n=1 Tax=Anaeromyxobacter sp. (strain Fw109-5) TaxID=404589 RepID=UPI0000ED7181|nr:PEGA domain-containing protein [Anaeromyxobacter sp. Fw109-5]ABS27953.1 PEGA domain protein [Anaeromyxobacter sp. Fw109-5]